jgi:electron transfer flavoprotein alpha subunit
LTTPGRRGSVEGRDVIYVRCAAMLAVIPIRDGDLPAGADEVLAECGGVGWIVGTGTAGADVDGLADDIAEIELGDFQAGRWARALAGLLAREPGVDAVVLPSSPDGRDLAPRLAHALGWPLLAGAVRVAAHAVTLVRRGGLEEHTVHPSGSFVATFQPGARGHDPDAVHRAVARRTLTVDADPDEPQPRDATVVDVLPPDVTTMDLTEARRIVGGGAGLDDARRFTQLTELATSIGASMGATRVITDRAWVEHDKQIGTTGVVVDPDLYIAFGISGAVQHTSGLGTPDHIISVNTDAHCPMMQMSDLAIVGDANATLDELYATLVGRELLATPDRGGAAPPDPDRGATAGG